MYNQSYSNNNIENPSEENNFNESEDYPESPIEISIKDIFISIAGGLIASGVALVYLYNRFGHIGFGEAVAAISVLPAGAMATYIMSKFGEAIKDFTDHIH